MKTTTPCSICGKTMHDSLYSCEHIGKFEQEKLAEYIRSNGKLWKSKLRAEWADGSDVLRQTRNIIGPSGLDRIRPEILEKR